MENTHLVFDRGVVVGRCSEWRRGFERIGADGSSEGLSHGSTPHLPKLGAKISCPQDTNNANLVSKDNSRNVLQALRVAPQSSGCLQPVSDGILAIVPNINSQTSQANASLAR